MTVHKFALVVEGDVAGTISLDDAISSPAVQRHIAAYNSDPRIIPITTDQDVKFGWTWNGAEFIPPVV